MQIKNDRYKEAFAAAGQKIEEGYRGDMKIILSNGLPTINGNGYISFFKSVANREFAVDLLNWSFPVINGNLEVHFTVSDMWELTAQ